MKVMIWQLPMSNPNCFYPVESEAVNLFDYVLVYDGSIPGVEGHEDLEKLYEILNIDHPKDYHARSLSVSDLVIFGAETCGYVVDIVGFKKVNIMPTRKERNIYEKES